MPFANPELIEEKEENESGELPVQPFVVDDKMSFRNFDILLKVEE